jgi:hypothetical protein
MKMEIMSGRTMMKGVKSGRIELGGLICLRAEAWVVVAS